MSSIIQHYDRSQRKLIRAQHAVEMRGVRFASTHTPLSSSVPRSSSASRTPAHAVNAIGAIGVPLAAAPANRDFSKLNTELLRDMEARNRCLQEEAILSSRAKHSNAGAPHRVNNERGATSSAAVDMVTSDAPPIDRTIRHLDCAALTAEGLGAASVGQHRHAAMPKYLLHRRIELLNQLQQRQQAAMVAECEKAFPPGREPLNPDVAEHTKEYLVARVAELESSLTHLSFKAALSASGQRKRAEIEAQLRDAETALMQFQFPVVYVRSSKPTAVLAARNPPYSRVVRSKPS